ncbi:cation:proton antiporter [Photobacterium iliopiscarium]|jgi:NhaP-type Na+/H+ or K+/H+ antiporter|uniref:Sodium:proton antiporter n=2 Tax=Photobacterium iliopiscarium TaxID=56192 RepID=A0A2T3MJQ6_9GAMM|nr:sodium:proton antiporter [Photobacterium iliopiscarium]KJG13890.1 sodium:proton antiporter [Photobacterium iliopiscarium]PST96247.1 sodium:proton antiporter [Photobacterium iliopiscarium]PST99786.1 sodium:proton antiporter [Photobacterium iliopiscarium]PSV85158.1 sodium:proton antiporter [Photobacterium iliopiscarium]PSV95614.1 sodium:proton antiporter [Photobacterium iliopiscarium]
MHQDMIGLTIAGLGVLGLGCQWLAWRMKLPAILLLLIAGLLIGPVAGVFNPNILFGDLLFPLISLAVAVILFEGSLTLNFAEIKTVRKNVKSIVTIGAIVTWVITSVATHYLLDFSWSLAFLFGSMTVVTGPTVIVPLLRTVRPQAKLANILRWEGILIDPIGAIFVVIVYEFIVSSSPMHSLEVFGLMLLVGLVIGAVAGWLIAYVLRNHLLPEYLQPFAVLAVVLGVFAGANVLESEAGLLAVTVMGMWLANAKDVDIRHILHFKENLTILLISGLFLILASRIQLADFHALGWGAITLFVVIQLVARPASIFISTIFSELAFKEKLFLAWVAPRGIVAAAISALFALKLIDDGVAGAQLLVPLTFMVIIGTVVLQSLTARPIARLLGVAEPSPKGFLIVGANDVAREIGLALKKYDCRVVMTDSNWDYIRAARMAGLETYYGNAVSSHADEYLDLIGVGHLLALTPDKHFNAVATSHYETDFGQRNIFRLNGRRHNSGLEKHSATQAHSGTVLFGDDISYKKLASLINQGAEIKHTKLSDNFTLEDYFQQYKGSSLIPLFVIDLKQNIFPFTDVSTLEAKAGWTMIALVKESV